MDITRKLKKGVKEGQLRISKMRGELQQEEEALLLGCDSASAIAKSGKSKESSASMQDNWLTAMVTCGSNAFGQINSDSFELMSSSLRFFSDLPQCDIHTVSCGHSITASIVTEAQSKSSTVFQAPGEPSLSPDQSSLCYLWGSALPGSSSAPQKVPYPLKIRDVRAVSCGQSHAALITAEAKVYTWGAGDSGMLGHGNKISLPSPKLVDAMSSLLCLSVSCGAFHTAMVACEQGAVTYLKVPRAGRGGQGPGGDGFREEDEFLECGQLYTCGLDKAGQLGLGGERHFVGIPTWVSSLHAKGFKAARVSCGFHHTMIIATPVHSVRVFTTSVFTCGWGEHGRLGLGDEDGRSLPALVVFPAPFHALGISAGEQHSLACGREGSYSWGSNAMGQLGVGNPSVTEFSCEPIRVPLPEGMVIKKIAAGGRHSAGITYCDKLLTWGWGEEGQLGHGTEKSTYLPRPCRVPKIRGRQAVPMELSLGLCHTAVVVRNASYVEPFVPRVSPARLPLPSSPIVVPKKEEEPEPVIVEPEPVIVEPPEVVVYEEPPARDPSPEPESPPSPEPVPVVRSIKELLQQREERMMNFRTVESPPRPPPMPEVLVEEPLAVEEPEPVPEVAEVVKEEKGEPEYIAAAPKVVEDRYKIFYMDGQNTDNCLVANSAKRAEARRKRKEEESRQKKDGNASKVSNRKIYI